MLGGYGYTTEYLPEALLRDQKLNTLHEGTSGIQGLDLLGRKVVAGGGAALSAFAEEVERTVARARAAGVEEAWCGALEQALSEVAALTLEVASRGLEGDVEGMLRHSADYLELFSVLAVGWCWLAQAAAAEEGLRHSAEAAEVAFYEGKRCAAQYWFTTELPRIPARVALVRNNEDSYARMRPDWF